MACIDNGPKGVNIKTSRAHARPGWRCAEGCIGCDVVFYNGLTCLFIPRPWGSVSIGTQES
jgi:hypothetical protein